MIQMALNRLKYLFNGFMILLGLEFYRENKSRYSNLKEKFIK